MAETVLSKLLSSSPAPPTIITNIFSNNKKLFILLGVILIAVLILKWFQIINQKLKT